MKLQLVAFGIAVLFLLPGAIYGSTLDDSGTVPSLETTATITVSAPTVTAEGSYLTVLLPGASTSYQHAGAPILPTVQHTFTFPLGTSIIDVTCQPAGRQTERLPGKIMPARHPVPIGSPASSTVEEDQEIYRSRSLFPGRWHEHRIGGGLADGARVTVVTVTLYPVQYIPAQGQLVYASAFDLRVRYRQP